MEIELKNGENLTLEVTPLILEYIEEYKGGLDKLMQDAQGKIDNNGYSRKMRAINHLLYAVIASNYHTNLTYRQAVPLVKLEDVNQIVDFVIENTPNINQVTKKTELNAEHRM